MAHTVTVNNLIESKRKKNRSRVESSSSIILLRVEVSYLIYERLYIIIICIRVLSFTRLILQKSLLYSKLVLRMNFGHVQDTTEAKVKPETRSATVAISGQNLDKVSNGVKIFRET